jgi:endonuclease/exonuclease/phosphatase family metal-dependent hydrolase
MPDAVLFCLLAIGMPSPIVIDGRFDDWADVPIALTDPADAPEAAVDFGEVRLAHDDAFVHLLVDFGRVVNLQHLEGSARLMLDADGNPRTGQTVGGLDGVDVVIEMTPPDADDPRRPGRGIALHVAGAAEPRSAYEVGFTFGPTYAGRTFEMRIRRQAVTCGVPRFLVGGSVSGRLEFADVGGAVRDRTDPFTHGLSPIEPTGIEQPSDPLARPSDADLRVVSWNVEFGGLTRTPDRFGRVLHALDPDVILFQEITQDTTPIRIVEFLRRRVPRRPRGAWNVLVGSGGGDLRTAVAARDDLDPARALSILPYPDQPDRALRIAAATVGDQRRLLVLSVHLRCCGWAGSFEDRTRQVEADLIQRAVAAALPSIEPDGVLIAGDLNLVGSRRPLDLLAANLDGDGSPLTIAEPVQIDGRSNATWSDPDVPFVPGRLDFLLYADSALQPVNSFVLDTRDLAPAWLDHHRLRAEDTDAASDHLPLVVDLRWIDRAR